MTNCVMTMMRRRKDNNDVLVDSDNDEKQPKTSGTSNKANKKISILSAIMLLVFTGGFFTGGFTLLVLLSASGTRPTLIFSTTETQKGDILRNLVQLSSSIAASSPMIGWRTKLSNDEDECLIKFGTYNGVEYIEPNLTIGKPRCLIESKFLKVQQHTVRQQLVDTNMTDFTLDVNSTNSTNSSDVIQDWLWIDYHERINVLVEAPGKPDVFMILEQSKYALEGRESLAIVGGIIEPGEIPDDAAQREIIEELGVNCTVLEFLGRYRTDVNRGMGWTHTFIATSCRKLSNEQLAVLQEEQKADDDSSIEASKIAIVGGADAEKYNIQFMSLRQIRDAVLKGRFLEIQWTATIALALLHVNFQPDIEMN